MKLLDMMYEQAFNERMAVAEAHGALVRMAKEAADPDTAFLAWLTTGSHEWPDDAAPVEWTAEDFDALNF